MCAIDREQRSEEHTSELQSHVNLVCRLLLEKKKKTFTLFNNNKKIKKCQNNIKIYIILFFFIFSYLTHINNITIIIIIILFFFFFNDTATTEIYTFPYTTLFRSLARQPAAAGTQFDIRLVCRADCIQQRL